MWGLMEVVAIIAAGGRGQRMGMGTCKQFIKLKGTSIIARTISKFQQCPAVHGIIVGVTPGEEKFFHENVMPELGHDKLVEVVIGGAERQKTVWNCIQRLPKTCKIVLVHDGVRPFVSTRLIEQVVSETLKKGAVIPALEAEETTKRVLGYTVVETLNRKEIWLAQTPQGFKKDILVKAYLVAKKKGLRGTDDASLVEYLGETVHVISGDKRNIKITTPADLKLALCLLESEA